MKDDEDFFGKAVLAGLQISAMMLCVLIVANMFIESAASVPHFVCTDPPSE